MGTWTVGLDISGSRIDGEGLVRLEEVLKREFPDFEIDCAIWSGWLGVHATIRSPTPPEALEAVLGALELAFDEAGIDMSRTSEVVNVTMRRAVGPSSAPDPASLPQALLRRLSRHREARPT